MSQDVIGLTWSKASLKKISIFSLSLDRKSKTKTVVKRASGGGAMHRSVGQEACWIFFSFLLNKQFHIEP